MGAAGGSAGGESGGERCLVVFVSEPSAKVVVRSDNAEGAANAAPMPCTARAASNIHPVAAKPPTRELKVKRAMPARKTRRRPSRSPARAPRSNRPPKVRFAHVSGRWILPIRSPLGA